MRKGLKIIFFILFSGFPVLSWGTEEQNAEEIFLQVVDKINSLKDCRVIFREYTSTGTTPALWGTLRVEGKYIHYPKIYYQRRLETSFNYKEQATEGFQEIYRSDTDMIELLMPGALRALGMIKVFPEDPKACGMRGESLKKDAPWDLMQELKEMLRQGKISAHQEKRGEQEFLVFEITQNPSTYYRASINRVKIWVKSENLLLFRIEKYTPKQDSAVNWKEFEVFECNTGLKPEEIKFEGFKSPFSLITTPRAEEVEPLFKPIMRTNKLSDPPPSPQLIINRFHQTIDAIKSYRVDLTMYFRYFRLRLYREDRFAYNREPYWFTIVTTAQKANYLLLNHSAGSVLWIDPADHNFHLIGGGVQKLLGEQIFSSNDYKFYSTLGDNPYEMDLIKIQTMLKKDFSNNLSNCWLVEYQNKKMYELQFVRSGERLPRHPGRINLLLDPETSLPVALELSDYDDPKGFLAMTFKNFKLNLPLEPGKKDF